MTRRVCPTGRPQACGAHLIVIDGVLMPLGVGQLPRLQTEQPINDTIWAKLMAIIGADSEPAANAPGPAPLPEPAPAPAPAPAGPERALPEEAAADSPAGGAPGSVDSSSVDGGGGGGSGTAAASPAPADDQQQQQQQALGSNVWEIEPSPPAPPGVPPDCATLAATGQLMRAENGSLVTDRCPPSITSAALSSGGTQTVVSDARQKSNSLLVVATEPPAPAPPASAAAPMLAGSWPAAVLAATLTMWPIWIARLP